MSGGKLRCVYIEVGGGGGGGKKTEKCVIILLALDQMERQIS